MFKIAHVIAFLAFSIILCTGCKHTESSSKSASGPSILLRESTVAEVNGLRVGCGSVFQGPDEKEIRATLVVIKAGDEISKRVRVGDEISVGSALFVVESIAEGRGRTYGSVHLKRKKLESD